MSVVVAYSQDDVAEALAVGNLRQDESERMRLENYGGRQYTREFERENHIVGAIGEWACARHFRLEFTGAVNDFTGTDIGGIIECRSRRRGPNCDLAMRANDAPKLRKPFVLSIVDLAACRVEIIGWLCGWEAMERAEDATHRHGVWYIPPPYHSVLSLEQWIACGHRQHWCPWDMVWAP